LRWKTASGAVPPTLDATARWDTQRISRLQAPWPGPYNNMATESTDSVAMSLLTPPAPQ